MSSEPSGGSFKSRSLRAANLDKGKSVQRQDVGDDDTTSHVQEESRSSFRRKTAPQTLAEALRLSTSRAHTNQSSAGSLQDKTAGQSSDGDSSKRGAVRAMAAKFEQEKQRDLSPVIAKSKSRTQSLISHFSQPPKTVRPTRSISILGRKNLRNASLASGELFSRTTSRSTAADEMMDRDLRISIGEDAALRALELRQTGRKSLVKQTRETRDESKGTVRGSSPAKKPAPELQGDTLLQNPPNLGTMTPYPKKPPVAQHLNLMRPSSSLSGSQQDAQAFLDVSSTPVPRPGSATMLHAQIRLLQKQLDVKTEEVVQLRRQLDAHANSELGTLSQKLREAKQQAEMWKERAEAAERRVQVFERFTSRLKGIRVADATEGEPSSSVLDNDHELEPLVGVAHSTTKGYESDGSGRTEEAGVVTARIRKCLHGPPKMDGAGDYPGMFSTYQPTPFTNSDGDGIVRGASPSAAEIWMAA